MAIPDKKLSIIIPVFNAEKYIESTLNSIQNQEFEDYEIIIIDDNSTDDSLKIISQINDPRILIITLSKNVGPGKARNIGINKASGEWLTFIDSDDQIKEHRFETIFEYISTDDEISFIADQVIFCFNSQKKMIPWKVKENIQWGKNQVKELNTTIYLGKQVVIKPFIKRKLIEDHNILFHESSFYGEDLYFYAKALHMSKKSLLLRAAFYLYRLTPDSLTASTDKPSLFNKVLYRMLEDPSYTENEKKLIHKRIKLNQNEILLQNFLHFLKKKQPMKALIHLFKHFNLILLIFNKIPPFLHYRITNKIKKTRT